MELTQETVTRVREGRGEVSFRRGCLIFVFGILGLIALVATAMLIFGLVTGTYSTFAYAFVSLFGTGGLSVGAWRVYLSMPYFYEPVPTGEGP